MHIQIAEHGFHICVYNVVENCIAQWKVCLFLWGPTQLLRTYFGFPNHWTVLTNQPYLNWHGRCEIFLLFAAPNPAQIWISNFLLCFRNYEKPPMLSIQQVSNWNVFWRSLWLAHIEPGRRQAPASLALSAQLQTGTWRAKTAGLSAAQHTSKQPACSLQWLTGVCIPVAGLAVEHYPVASIWRSTVPPEVLESNSATLPVSQLHI